MAQFVPIKLDVASDDYRTWNREHPSEGNGIPKVYIVRADGETLYAKPGGLSVEQLGQLLSTALVDGGRVLSAKEAAALIAIHQEMTALREQGKVADAIRTLRKLRKFGKPGEFGSYATPAVNLETLVNELSTEGQDSIERVSTALETATDQRQQLAALNDYMSTKDRFSGLATLKAPFAQLNRTITRNKQLNRLLKGLKTIDRAAQATSDKKRKTAIGKLETLIKTHPEGALFDRAQKELARLRKSLDD